MRACVVCERDKGGGGETRRESGKKRSRRRSRFVWGQAAVAMSLRWPVQGRRNIIRLQTMLG
jgi:hypothetical protein